MGKSWQQLVLATDKAQADDLEDTLIEAGALSITVEDAGDQPIFEPAPGETPVWTELHMTGLFEADTDLAAIISELKKNPGEVSIIRSSTLDDRAWEREWMTHFNPIQFGRRLWICPSWCEPPEPDAINLMLDPGLAFGTGTHETTALCLEWLEEQDLKDKQLIDYGCGSGILAIASLLLGCESVIAVDNDPQALQATRQNGLANSIYAEKLRVTAPQFDDIIETDIVLANILAGPLIELSSRLASLVTPGGQIVLSGILAEQIDAVSEAYLRFFKLDEPSQRGDWVRLTGTRFTS